MTLHPPIWQQNNAYPANQDRQVMHAAVDVPGTLGWGDGGPAPGIDLRVTQRALGANMSVDVAPGRATVAGTDTADQGKYLVRSDAVVNVVIATAPGAGQERIDLVVARVRDAAVVGGVNNDWVLAAVAGTPAATGTAVEPAAPASSLVLARILVSANVTQILDANITDRRKRMALLRRPDEARGVVNGAVFRSAVNGAALAGAPTDSDFVLNNIVIAGNRDYRVHLKSRTSMPSVSQFDIRFKVNGVVNLLMQRVSVVSNISGVVVNATVLWLPLAGTFNLGIDVLLVSGSGTLTFTAGSLVEERQFWVEDAGPRFPVAGL